jgi:mycothiol synthase
MPADHATVTSDERGRLVVAVGAAEVDIVITAPEGVDSRVEAELILVRSGDLGALTELTTALDRIRTEPPYDQARLQLVADRAAEPSDPLADALAEVLGLHHQRDLLQMRRPLPVEADHGERGRAPHITTRPIDLGVEPEHDERRHSGSDVDAWLRVNNRAFATHPDQGRETVGSFRRRLGVELDDPSGFLVLHDERRPGELAGFCWTKIHDATEGDPVLGEIYVIGVDPTRHGEGLGTSLVLAGLDHLASRGVTTAMLYVEADNDPARRLYDRLGFLTHRWRRLFTGGDS